MKVKVQLSHNRYFSYFLVINIELLYCSAYWHIYMNAFAFLEANI